MGDAAACRAAINQPAQLKIQRATCRFCGSAHAVRWASLAAWSVARSWWPPRESTAGAMALAGDHGTATRAGCRLGWRSCSASAEPRLREDDSQPEHGAPVIPATVLRLVGYINNRELSSVFLLGVGYHRIAVSLCVSSDAGERHWCRSLHGWDQLLHHC
eukprot:SAG31_NODE_2906_length_4924_cov_4.748187_2_plen_160_part_00